MDIYNKHGRTVFVPEISENIGEPKMLHEDNTWGVPLPQEELQKFSWMHGDPPVDNMAVVGNGWKTPRTKRAKKSAK
jgi:hypothetical protein